MMLGSNAWAGSLLDPSFRLDRRAEGRVDAVLPLADGRILVGGVFPNLGDTNSVTAGSPRLIRLHGDGSLDDSYSGPVFREAQMLGYSGIGSLVNGPDGAIWAVHRESYVPWGEAHLRKSTSFSQIWRLDANGRDLGGTVTLDAGIALTFLPDGTPVYFGAKGWVQFTGGFAAPFLAVGSRQIYLPGNDLNASGSVSAFLALKNGDYLVAGEFGRSPANRENPYESNGLMRIRASGEILWAAQAHGVGFLREDADGSLFVGAGTAFTRFSADGRVIRAPVNESDFLARYSRSLLLENGGIVVAGRFRGLGQVPRESIAAFDPSGTLELRFDPGVGFAFATFFGAPYFSALAQQSDGRLLVAGDFDAFDGEARTNLVRLFPTNPPPVADEAKTAFYAFASAWAYECGDRPRIQIFRAGEATASHSIRVRTEDETALAGVDYEPLDQVLVFAPGERQKELVLLPKATVEQPANAVNTTFVVTLSEAQPPIQFLGTNRFQVTIFPRECLVSFPTNKLTVMEGADPTQVGLLVPNHLKAGVRSRDITARKGVDYLAPDTDRRYLDYLQIVAPDNRSVDGDRTFLLEFSPPNDGRIIGYPSNMVVTIRDNDTLAGVGRGITGQPRMIYSLPDGGWLMLAHSREYGFNSVDGQPVVNIARFKADGTFDPSLLIATNLTDRLACALPLAGGRLLIGRGWSPYRDSVPALLRLNADGSVDSSFQFPFAAAAAVSISAIVPSGTAGEVMAGGYFGDIGKSQVVLVSLTGQVLRTWDLGSASIPDAASLASAAAGTGVVRGYDSLLRLRSTGITTVVRSNNWSVGPLLSVSGSIWMISGGSSIEFLNPSGGLGGELSQLRIGGTNFTIRAVGPWDCRNGQIITTTRLTHGPIPNESIHLLVALDGQGNVLKAKPLPWAMSALAVASNGTVAGICANPPGVADPRWLRFDAELEPINDVRLVRAVYSAADQSVHLALDGQAPRGYAVEASADLRTWETVRESAEVHSGQTFVDVPQDRPEARFYRVRH